jgi:hypothetical protein
MRTYNKVIQRPSVHRVVVVGPFGITLWRRGAVSLQAWGRFLQVVIGDWWRAT